MEDESLRLYDLLSSIVGSEDVIQTRRELLSALTVLLSTKEDVFLASGSKAEGLDMKNSDFDVMFMNMNVRVFESANDMIGYTYPLCTMDCHDTKLGFTRLRVPNLKYIFHKFYKCVVVLEDVLYLSRLLIQEKQLEINPSKHILMVHGPCLSTKGGEIEYLECFRCHEWITVAQPWISRARGKWPCREVIDKITDSGVLFVPVGCKNSPNEDIEWRISFSVAEKELIHSFTHTQMLCYAALKMILSDIIKPRHGELLCSYFLKSIMFWLAEEINQTKWIPSNFVWCFEKCLKRLLYCVTYRACLHYFIPEVNFFEDRFSESEYKQLFISVTEINDTGVDVIRQTATIQNNYLDKFVRGPICSSFTSVYTLTKTTVFGQFFAIDNVMTKAIHYNSKTVLLLLSSCFSYTVDMQVIDVQSCNKTFYRKYKKCRTWCSIGLSSDAFSGWCKMASLFYKCKQYINCRIIIRYCLSKCTPDTILLGLIDPYITNQQSILVGRKYFKKAIKHFVLDSVMFTSDNIFPQELMSLFRQYKTVIFVPPIVYLHFLDSLCAYHQGNNMDMMDSVACLERVINEQYLMISTEYQKNIAQNCLDVAQSLLNGI